MEFSDALPRVQCYLATKLYQKGYHFGADLKAAMISLCVCTAARPQIPCCLLNAVAVELHHWIVELLNGEKSEVTNETIVGQLYSVKKLGSNH